DADADPAAGADADADPAADDAPEPAAPPEVGFVLDRDVLPGNQWVTITVRAHAEAGVADVVLAWASDDARYVVSCAGPRGDAPISCKRVGDTFRFRVHAGVGRRAIAAAAFDRDGGHS